MAREKVYVFGHQKPDTDSVTSAISVAYLKRRLGVNAEARILGEINKETNFVLNYFKVKEPKYLDSVRLQIKDVDYYKDYYICEDSTIIDTYKYFNERGITGAPVVDKNKKIKGVITSKDIVKRVIEDDYIIKTSYDNLVRSVSGDGILKYSDELTGKIIISNTSIISIEKDNKVNTVIIVGDNISDEYIDNLKEKKVNIIRTELDLVKVIRNVINSQYIKNLMNEKNFYKFNQNDNFYEFLKEARRLGHNNYPVVGRRNECLGLIRVTDKNIKHNKKVILVDHNESSQSVDGLAEANIIEVVDHHKIGDLSTSDPINFRNMAVGSTNTIVYQMYRERLIDIPYEIAGMMISGILSDTLCLTSSTTTELDKITVELLAQDMNFDYKNYYREMLKSGTSIEGLSKLEVLTQDYKNFQVEDKKYSVTQTITLDIDSIMKDKNNYLTIMEERRNNQDLEFILFIITDVLKNGSYILYTNGCEEMLTEAFSLDDVYEGVFVPGLTSRKKQVIPYINDYIK